MGYDAEDINLNNVSLHIYQGEALGIIGEPGSSKTLIGRILSGSVKPDKGKVVRTKTCISVILMIERLII